MLYILAVILFIIPYNVIFWNLYVKAGKPGWTAIVPVYNCVVLADIVKKNIIIGLISGSFIIFSVLRNVIDSPVLGILRLVTAVFGLYLLNAFIKQFNRGIGYWALVLFLPFIAVFLKDKTEYKVSLVTPPTEQVIDKPVV